MKTVAEKTKLMMIAGSAMVAFLALGCGEQKQAAVETSETHEAAVERPTATAAVAASVPTPEAEPITEGNATNDTLPPDVTASATDSLVAPGTVVTITAQGSTDVTSMILMDRLGQKTPMRYDVDVKAWTAQYRVPLTTHIDRLGLSITATNGQNRWKRVWVFLGIQGGVPEEGDGC
jgi:hypothetical protein